MEEDKLPVTDELVIELEKDAYRHLDIERLLLCDISLKLSALKSIIEKQAPSGGQDQKALTEKDVQRIVDLAEKRFEEVLTSAASSFHIREW